MSAFHLSKEIWSRFCLSVGLFTPAGSVSHQVTGAPDKKWSSMAPCSCVRVCLSVCIYTITYIYIAYYLINIIITHIVNSVKSECWFALSISLARCELTVPTVCCKEISFLLVLCPLIFFDWVVAVVFQMLTQSGWHLYGERNPKSFSIFLWEL